MKLAHFALLLPGCVLWDSHPFAENIARLSDSDSDGVSVAAGDCNDANPAVHPGAVDSCDGLDNDCDSQTDEEAPDTVWCQDVDQDGFGDPTHQARTCFPEAGWVSNCTDCNDADGGVNTDATESCNGIDDNCDGAIDPDGSDGSAEWYPDDDGDGYGAETTPAFSCETPPSSSSNNTDCDDHDSGTHPGATEVCNNGEDNNCDGSANACTWSGSTLLNTTSAAFIAGPETRFEYVGYSVGFIDVNADNTDDILFSSTGAMYGDSTSGALHVWYGAPVGERDVDDASAHVVGAEDLYLALNAGHGPVLPLLDELGSLQGLLVASQGASSAFDERGAILSIPIGPSGTTTVTPDMIFARGAFPREGFGTTVTSSTTVAAGGNTLVVGAPFNGQRGTLGGAVYVTRTSAPNADDSVASFLGSEGEVLGASILATEDLTGDGIQDLVLGSGYVSTPTIYLFEGYVSGGYLTSDADASASAAGWVTELLGPATDLNGDGITDLAVPSGDRVNLLSGAALSTSSEEGLLLGSLNAEGKEDLGVGQGMALGDMYSDGVMDLVVGVPFVDTPGQLGGVSHGGAVAVVPLDEAYEGGHDLWAAASAVFYGPDQRAEIGFPLAIGDINNDDANDLLIGAAGWSSNGYPEAGGVWFILGGGI